KPGGLPSLDVASGVSFWKAFWIGVAQGAAIAPGISRSGSTIAAALFLKVSRDAAVLFSFLLSIPAILGAAVLQLRHVEFSQPNVWQSLLTGFIVSYIFGLIGLWGIVYVVKRGRLQYFSYYLWALSAIILLHQSL
ncbi:MAG: undecaprenyl-diphosphate phosphatase, partial [Bdellovibrio sp.]